MVHARASLSWFEVAVTMLKERGEPWESFTMEIDGTIRDIRKGVGVDFRECLRATA